MRRIAGDYVVALEMVSTMPIFGTGMAEYAVTVARCLAGQIRIVNLAENVATAYGRAAVKVVTVRVGSQQRYLKAGI